MKLLFTSILLLLACVSFAQRQNIYFLTNKGKYVSTKDSADFIRIVREPDSASTLYNVFEFYKDGKKKMIGKSSKVVPIQLEGQCIFFYENGLQKSNANFKNGQITGLDVEFYPNGKTYVIKEYDKIVKYPKDPDDRFIIKANYDSLGHMLVENGNGYYKGYDNRLGHIEEEGSIKEGKRDGLWKGTSNGVDSAFTFTESYNMGKLITGVMKFDDGASFTYKKARLTYTRFKGGEGFINYIGRRLPRASNSNKQDIDESIVILSFTVEADGKLSNVNIEKTVNPLQNNEIIKIVKASPQWISATAFGRPISTSYTFAIDLLIDNR